ncbi:hypothetical protein DERP_003056 [Dermatophagoides pteronyssinus]|uniref:X-linked retinitis pigmentosa GTPase regulator-like n=1 Tax=Dermatophagoides pteronyssinus TaxID=6956 RepID=A0ABQ8JJ65_DERPT|nr:hypothetical protein DERP_003056 [Dermatophagoides pteronyssinus]
MKKWQHWIIPIDPDKGSIVSMCFNQNGQQLLAITNKSIIYVIPFNFISYYDPTVNHYRTVIENDASLRLNCRKTIQQPTSIVWWQRNKHYVQQRLSIALIGTKSGQISMIDLDLDQEFNRCSISEPIRSLKIYDEMYNRSLLITSEQGQQYQLILEEFRCTNQQQQQSSITTTTKIEPCLTTKTSISTSSPLSKLSELFQSFTSKESKTTTTSQNSGKFSDFNNYYLTCLLNLSIDNDDNAELALLNQINQDNIVQMDDPNDNGNNSLISTTTLRPQLIQFNQDQSSSSSIDFINNKSTTIADDIFSFTNDDLFVPLMSTTIPTAASHHPHHSHSHPHQTQQSNVKWAIYPSQNLMIKNSTNANNNIYVVKYQNCAKLKLQQTNSLSSSSNHSFNSSTTTTTDNVSGNEADSSDDSQTIQQDFLIISKKLFSISLTISDNDSHHHHHDNDSNSNESNLIRLIDCSYRFLLLVFPSRLCLISKTFSEQTNKSGNRMIGGGGGGGNQTVTGSPRSPLLLKRSDSSGHRRSSPRHISTPGTSSSINRFGGSFRRKSPSNHSPGTPSLSTSMSNLSNLSQSNCSIIAEFRFDDQHDSNEIIDVFVTNQYQNGINIRDYLQSKLLSTTTTTAEKFSNQKFDGDQQQQQFDHQEHYLIDLLSSDELEQGTNQLDEEFIVVTKQSVFIIESKEKSFELCRCPRRRVITALNHFGFWSYSIWQLRKFFHTKILFELNDDERNYLSWQLFESLLAIYQFYHQNQSNNEEKSLSIQNLYDYFYEYRQYYNHQLILYRLIQLDLYEMSEYLAQLHGDYLYLIYFILQYKCAMIVDDQQQHSLDSNRRRRHRHIIRLLTSKHVTYSLILSTEFIHYDHQQRIGKCRSIHLIEQYLQFLFNQLPKLSLRYLLRLAWIFDPKRLSVRLLINQTLFYCNQTYLCNDKHDYNDDDEHQHDRVEDSIEKSNESISDSESSLITSTGKLRKSLLPIKRRDLLNMEIFLQSLCLQKMMITNKSSSSQYDWSFAETVIDWLPKHLEIYQKNLDKHYQKYDQKQKLLSNEIIDLKNYFENHIVAGTHCSLIFDYRQYCLWGRFDYTFMNSERLEQIFSFDDHNQQPPSSSTTAECRIPLQSIQTNRLTKPQCNRYFSSLINDPIRSISIGYQHLMILTDNGIYAIGSSTFGQLGLGSQILHTRYPLLLEFGQNITGDNDSKKIWKIVCGSYHTLLLSIDGHLYSFGWSLHGQLGHGNSIDDQYEPKLIRYFIDTIKVSIADVAAGYAHTAALTTTGDLYLFGQNCYGQLGIEGEGGCSGNKFFLPQRFTLISGPIRMICCGPFHTVCIAIDHDQSSSSSDVVKEKLYCWGIDPKTWRLKMRADRQTLNNQHNRNMNSYGAIGGSGGYKDQTVDYTKIREISLKKLPDNCCIQKMSADIMEQQNFSGTFDFDNFTDWQIPNDNDDDGNDDKSSKDLKKLQRKILLTILYYRHDLNLKSLIQRFEQLKLYQLCSIVSWLANDRIKSLKYQFDAFQQELLLFKNDNEILRSKFVEEISHLLKFFIEQIDLNYKIQSSSSQSIRCRMTAKLLDNFLQFWNKIQKDFQMIFSMDFIQILEQIFFDKSMINPYFGPLLLILIKQMENDDDDNDDNNETDKQNIRYRLGLTDHLLMKIVERSDELIRQSLEWNHDPIVTLQELFAQSSSDNYHHYHIKWPLEIKWQNIVDEYLRQPTTTTTITDQSMIEIEIPSDIEEDPLLLIFKCGHTMTRTKFQSKLESIDETPTTFTMINQKLSNEEIDYECLNNLIKDLNCIECYHTK